MLGGVGRWLGAGLAGWLKLHCNAHEAADRVLTAGLVAPMALERLLCTSLPTVALPFQPWNSNPISASYLANTPPPPRLAPAAERTEPTSADQHGTPLLVSSYDSRLVEIVNGRVKAQAGVEPAYLSQPLSEVAHSPALRPPSRSPSRSPRGRSGGALGPLASLNSFGSLSPAASSSAL